MLEWLLNHFYELWTIWWAIALTNIIFIDIVMSWDNAIIIWMATQKLKWAQRKKAIVIWILLATILRIIFASMTIFLMSIIWLKLAWWVLLLYVVWKFYKELRNDKEFESNKDMKWKWTTFMSAIWMIILADVSMSLDNVLAVAWAAWENPFILIIWLIFSIILMAFASNYIANKLDQYPQIQWLGLIVILFVAMEMMIKWSTEIQNHVSLLWQINILPFVLFIIWMIWIILHNRYIKPINEKIIKDWMANNYLSIIMFNILIFTLTVFLWNHIHAFLISHQAILYMFLTIMLFIMIELISILKLKNNK